MKAPKEIKAVADFEYASTTENLERALAEAKRKIAFLEGQISETEDLMKERDDLKAALHESYRDFDREIESSYAQRDLFMKLLARLVE